MNGDAINLNSTQKQAIEYHDGPLLIVAGAGTGKTTTLVEKISYLIKKELAKPDEILCLTFTEKAAYEMEERVDLAMPYGYFQMWISTFHGFADDILRNDIHHLGLNPSYTLMTQAQSIVFLRNNLFHLNLNYFRPVGNPNKFIEGLLQHFSRLQDEDVSPEEYGKWIQSAFAKAPADKTELQQLQELSTGYTTYQKMKREQDMMDFGDLIFYLNELFRTRPSVLKQYQKKFKYVLVDEFQDTNIAQYELIKLLCPPQKTPKLTVVGDDSQAIYKFRGASVSNILTFMDDYKKSRQVTLRDNYRSNQSILDHAYKLIQQNNPDTLESRLGISKELKSHKKDKKNAVTVELFHNGDDEADWIANQIYKLTAKSYKLQDIAILVRANKHSDPIINALKRKGIPYQFLGPGTLFRQPEVKDLIAYLNTLADLNDTVSLYRVLSMDLFKLNAEDLVLFLSFSNQISRSLYQAIEISLSFFEQEWFQEEYEQYRPHLPLITVDTRTKLIIIIKMMKRHLARISRDTAGEILYYFLEDTGYLERLSNPESEAGEKETLNISKFFRKLKEIENSQQDASVFAIADFIRLSMELGESPVAGETDIATYNAVNILTVHGAKGLEFPVVFLPDLIRGRFPTYRRREQIPIPEGIIKEQMPAGDYHIQEERRLFYVGLTRAKDVAFLTAAEIYGEGQRKRKVSPFVYETMGTEMIENKTMMKREEKEQLSIFDFKKGNEPVLKAPVEVNNISYSQLQTYELCPLQYKYQYVLKIPTRPAAAASFGSTIHHVLQKYYQEYLTDRSVGIPHLHNLLAASWIPVGYNSQAHEKRMKQEALQMLENYYHSFHQPEIEIINLEQFFKIKVGSAIYLTGKIDRVDRKGNGAIEIIDYKTGKMPDEKKFQKDLQLAIYARAASDPGLYNKPIEKINLSFYYLQTREKITVQRSADDIKEVETRVKETVKQIREGDFPAHVGPWCDFCSFRMICEAWQ